MCYYKINTLVIVPFCYKFIEYLSLEMNRNIKTRKYNNFDVKRVDHVFNSKLVKTHSVHSI